MITLRENEQVVKIVRQHRSVVAGKIVWAVILAGLILFALLQFNVESFKYLKESAAGVILITFLVIIHKIYIWRKNALVITNQRIVFHLKSGLFSRTVTEILYKDIHDISFKQSGMGGLFYRYGKLIIKTPLGGEMIFDKVSSPAKVVETINKVRSEYR